MTPKAKIKIFIWTTALQTQENLDHLDEACRKLKYVMGWMEDAEVSNPAILPFRLVDRRPKIMIDTEGKVRIVHSSFEELFTKPILEAWKELYPDHLFVILVHLEPDEKKALGLEPNIKGTYWNDKNHYMEAWVSSDLTSKPPANRTQFYKDDDGKKVPLTALEWLLMHETGHAVTHFSGRKEELKNKYGDDPVHYLDYSKHDVTKIFREVSFKKWSLLAYGVSLATQLLGLLKAKKNDPLVIPAPTNKLEAWAKAIQTFEDYVPPGGKYRGGGIAKEGSLSWRNNNPGNLRWSPYEIDNINNFSVFATYEEGWKALLFQLRIAVDGRSNAYRPNMTLLQFFEKYAPSGDNNHPATYAKFVADQLGVSVDTIIKDLAK